MALKVRSSSTILPRSPAGRPNTTASPYEEDFANLVRGKHHAEYSRWLVFEDLSRDMPGKNVLLTIGDTWTIWSAADFRACVDRILKQL